MHPTLNGWSWDAETLTEEGLVLSMHKCKKKKYIILDVCFKKFLILQWIAEWVIDNVFCRTALATINLLNNKS